MQKKPCLVYNDSLEMGLRMEKVFGHRSLREPNVNTEMPSKIIIYLSDWQEKNWK